MAMNTAIGPVPNFLVGIVVALAETFGYTTELRSLTQGRAQPNVTPSHYEEVPASIALEIKAKAAGGR